MMAVSVSFPNAALDVDALRKIINQVLLVYQIYICTRILAVFTLSRCTMPRTACVGTELSGYPSVYSCPSKDQG